MVELSHLHSFDGVSPHSVIVMNNASIHNVNEVAQLIESAGAPLYFLPPYCPDLSPIEEAFSKLKSQTECRQWIQHAGYLQSYFFMCSDVKANQ